MQESEVNFGCLSLLCSTLFCQIFLRWGLSLNLELIDSAKLISQWVSGICLFQSTFHPHHGYRLGALCLTFYMNTETLKTNPIFAQQKNTCWAIPRSCLWITRDFFILIPFYFIVFRTLVSSHKISLSPF